MTAGQMFAHLLHLDRDLRDYCARMRPYGGPCATDAYQWIERWCRERRVRFRVKQSVVSNWLRTQGLLATRHCVQSTPIGRSSNTRQRDASIAAAKVRQETYRTGR